MDSKVYIYGLRCPVVGKIRYIGKSNQPQRRLYLHLFAASHGYYKNHTCRWLGKLLRSGLQPTLEILCEVPSGEDWRHYERKCIADAIDDGLPLTNKTAGGEGVIHLTQEGRDRANAARQASMTAERRARMSERTKQVWADPEKRRRISIGQKTANERPARKEQLKKLWKYGRSPEGEANRLAAVKAYWANPENKRKLSELTKIRMSNPEIPRAMNERCKELRRLKLLS